MISRANKILSRSNNILSRRNKLKNKTCMSLPGFRWKRIEKLSKVNAVKEKVNHLDQLEFLPIFPYQNF